MNAVITANEGDTILTLKELTPVRLIKNEFYNKVHEAEAKCASKDEMEAVLGRARAKKGMFEGDMEEGELEIGQVSSIIRDIKPAANILADMWQEFTITAKNPFLF